MDVFCFFGAPLLEMNEGDKKKYFYSRHRTPKIRDHKQQKENRIAKKRHTEDHHHHHPRNPFLLR
jgi:hypothetical protein